MGAKVKKKLSAEPKALTFLRPNSRGELARVAHPADWTLDWDEGIAKITEIAVLLENGPERVLLTGGGFITSYPPLNRTADLARLNEIVSKHIPALNQVRGHLDLCVGVDLLDDRDIAVGQGIVFAGASGSTVAWKTLPLGGEANYVATFDDKIIPQISRYVETATGTAGLMVCHDLQMANHRTQALVRPHTMRGRVIAAMRRQFNEEAPELILNAVHWINDLSNTKTFRTSLLQIVDDNDSVKRAAAAFGYADGIRSDAELLDIFDRLKSSDFVTTDLAFK